MVKKSTLQEVLDLIDASHEVRNIQQIAHNSDNDNTRLNASTKLLEIAGVIKADKSAQVNLNIAQPTLEEIVDDGQQDQQVSVYH